MRHDILDSFVLNINQTALSYVSPGKYTFSFKGLKFKSFKVLKNVSIKRVDDKRQVTATFFVSFTLNNWSRAQKSIKFFDEIIVHYLEKVKEEKGFPKKQHSLVIMETFKGQDNDILKTFCSENFSR